MVAEQAQPIQNVRSDEAHTNGVATVVDRINREQVGITLIASMFPNATAGNTPMQSIAISTATSSVRKENCMGRFKGITAAITESRRLIFNCQKRRLRDFGSSHGSSVYSCEFVGQWRIILAPKHLEMLVALGPNACRPNLQVTIRSAEQLHCPVVELRRITVPKIEPDLFRVVSISARGDRVTRYRNLEKRISTKW